MLAAIDWGEVWEPLAAVGTLIAAVVAAVAARSAASAAKAAERSAGAAESVVDIEKERRAEERAAQLRSHVVATYVIEGDRSALRIVNYGPAEATDLTLTVDPMPTHLDPGKLPRVLPAYLTSNLPYTRMPYQAESTTVLEWTDAAGDRRRIEVPWHPVTLEAAPPQPNPLVEGRRRAAEMG